MSGRRCTDNMPGAGKLCQIYDECNSIISKLDPVKLKYKEVSADEPRPSGDDGTYQQTLIGKSKQSEATLEAMRWLTHGDRFRDGQAVPWTLQERSSSDWLEHFEDAVKLVHDLKENDEPSPDAFFCMKADALNLLATLAPPGATRDKAMEEFREFLEGYYPSVQNPNLWFTMFRHVLYAARLSEDQQIRNGYWTLWQKVLIQSSRSTQNWRPIGIPLKHIQRRMFRQHRNSWASHP